MEAYRFYVVIAVIGLIFALVTFLLGKYFRTKKIIKYIPALFAALSAVAFYFKAIYFSEGFEGIGYMILTLIAVVVLTVSLITALIMGLVYRNKGRDTNGI